MGKTAQDRVFFAAASDARRLFQARRVVYFIGAKGEEPELNGSGGPDIVRLAIQLKDLGLPGEEFLPAVIVPCGKLANGELVPGLERVVRVYIAGSGVSGARRSELLAVPDPPAVYSQLVVC